MPMSLEPEGRKGIPSTWEDPGTRFKGPNQTRVAKVMQAWANVAKGGRARRNMGSKTLERTTGITDVAPGAVAPVATVIITPIRVIIIVITLFRRLIVLAVARADVFVPIDVVVVLIVYLVPHPSPGHHVLHHGNMRKLQTTCKNGRCEFATRHEHDDPLGEGDRDGPKKHW